MDDEGDVPGQHEAARYYEAGHYHAHVEAKCIDAFSYYFFNVSGAKIDIFGLNAEFWILINIHIFTSLFPFWFQDCTSPISLYITQRTNARFLLNLLVSLEFSMQKHFVKPL